jgi:hypothetical protein
VLLGAPHHEAAVSADGPPERAARSSMPYCPGRGKRDGSTSKGLSRIPRSTRWPLPLNVACIGSGPSQLTLTGPVMISPSAGEMMRGRNTRSNDECIMRSVAITIPAQIRTITATCGMRMRR